MPGSSGLQHLTLVADANTAARRSVRGWRKALKGGGLDVTEVLVEGPEPVVADEKRLVQVMLAEPVPRVDLCCGRSRAR